MHVLWQMGGEQWFHFYVLSADICMVYAITVPKYLVATVALTGRITNSYL